MRKENEIPQQGLYRESFEHDNCGIGAIVNIKGQKSHSTVAGALHIVENLEHRAGKDAEGKTGDGVGILTQIPHNFFKKVCQPLGIDLKGERDYGVGMFFLPQDELKRNQAKKIFEVIVKKEGLKFLGWREVPIHPDILGKSAVDCMPCIMQAFIERPSRYAKGLEFDNVFVTGMEDGIFPGSRSMYSEDDLEEERRLAYVAITRARKKLYVTSAGRRMIFGQTQKNVTSRFIREIGKENFIKLDNSKKAAQIADDGVTEVQSLSLQQQLAREKRNYGSANTDTNSYQPGERVSHRIFGEGTILTVMKTANDSMLEIAFEKVGTKKIMANFAKLKKLS